ncbi:methyltransferase [Holotrichia oblita]|uniref:Methyltransferase n=2 Tax=Holotrichia oblita TaxID=644536 RepID=A0ACB9SQH3_HOLOL|nr:methyltransferase [Holotrichia oblita]KAI4454418.1 methyltransferase [Holotrichia oblita]
MSLKIRTFLSKNRITISNLIKRYTSTEQTAQAGQTHFGFQSVPEEEKSEKVHKVFEDVASKYDIMNDAMSMGIHRVWKDIFMHTLSPTNNTKLLDVAGGTGDIAFRFLDYVRNSSSSDGCHVTVCDINKAMLDVGESRCQKMNYDKKLISWKVGDAEKLPFEDNSFNAYTIAFGIRNVTHIDKALLEAYRVLEPGGRFLCLEFSQLETNLAQWLYDLYSFQVIPVMGHLIAGQWQHYQYLVESIRKFPNQETFKAMIEDAGFRQVTYENLTMGVVAIHSGFKL